MTDLRKIGKNRHLRIAPSVLVEEVAAHTGFSRSTVVSVIYGDRNNAVVANAVKETRDRLRMPDPRELIPAA